MMIRLVAVDIDGTLLNSQNQLSALTKETIRTLRRNGVKLILCTGRPFYGLHQLVKELGLDGEEEYVVSFNGAVAQEIESNRILFKQAIPFGDFHEIEQLSRELGVGYHIQSDDGIYTSNEEANRYTIFDGDLNGTSVQYRPLADLRDVSINKVMFVESKAYLDKVVETIPRYFFNKYNLMKSLDCFFEFLNKKANKGTALQLLTEKLGIHQSEILAIGDNDNDISMLEYAGVGVAMGNASASAKAAANFVTKTNDEDGVAYAIRNYI